MAIVLVVAPGAVGDAQAQQDHMDIPPSAVFDNNPDVTTDPATDAAPGQGGARSDVVTSAPLDDLDPAAMGLMTANNGGLPATLWQGSTAGVVLPLMQSAPANTTSPTMQVLLRRLTLTEATPPVSDGPDNMAFLRLRVARLVDAGSLGSLVGLYEKLPSMASDAALAQTHAEIQLLAGDTAGACALADEAGHLHDDVFWLQMQAFCRSRDGDQATASFAMDMAREMGANDPAWLAAMRHLQLSPGDRAGQALSLPAETVLTPLLLAMISEAGADLPLGNLAAVKPLVLRALLGREGLPAAARLQAAQLANRSGSLGNRALGNLFRRTLLPNDVVNQAANLPADDDSATANAAIFQAAALAGDSVQRSALLAQSEDRAANHAGLVGNAQIMGQIAQAIRPDGGIVNHAAMLTRMLIANGDMQGALNWYMTLRNAAAGGDANATTDLINLWPVMQVARVSRQVPWSDDVLGVWWQAQSVHPGAEKYDRGLRAFTIFAALGHDIDPAYWMELSTLTPDSAAAMNAPQLLMLRTAARQGRVGEVILLALNLLGPDGPAHTDSLVLGDIMRALGAIGMGQEARSLALEALLGSGL